MKSAASRIDRSTCDSAAKLTIASHPAAASATAAGSAMSPRRNSWATPSRFARLPEYVSLSSTTTVSPASASRRTKCDPMKPAPPVTSTRIGGRLAAELLDALAQPVAPVRQTRRTAFRAEDRVRRPRRLRAELLRRDPPHAAVEARLVEDRLREVGPRAVSVRRDVVDAERQLDDCRDCGREMRDVRRAAAL